MKLNDKISICPLILKDCVRKSHLIKVQNILFTIVYCSLAFITVCLLFLSNRYKQSKTMLTQFISLFIFIFCLTVIRAIWWPFQTYIYKENSPTFQFIISSDLVANLLVFLLQTEFLKRWYKSDTDVKIQQNLQIQKQSTVMRKRYFIVYQIGVSVFVISVNIADWVMLDKKFIHVATYTVIATLMCNIALLLIFSFFTWRALCKVYGNVSKQGVLFSNSCFSFVFINFLQLISTLLLHKNNNVNVNVRYFVCIFVPDTFNCLVIIVFTLFQLKLIFVKVKIGSKIDINQSFNFELSISLKKRLRSEKDIKRKIQKLKQQDQLAKQLKRSNSKQCMNNKSRKIEQYNKQQEQDFTTENKQENDDIKHNKLRQLKMLTNSSDTSSTEYAGLNQNQEQ